MENESDTDLPKINQFLLEAFYDEDIEEDFIDEDAIEEDVIAI